MQRWQRAIDALSPSLTELRLSNCVALNGVEVCCSLCAEFVHLAVCAACSLAPPFCARSLV
jgi:hypothetical protein